MVTLFPSGLIARALAKTDSTRGVHKAPANTALRGALGLTRSTTDLEQELLNRISINRNRKLDDGIKVWGARTLAEPASEFQDIPVRRFATMINKSPARGL
ncbi:MAG: phage tail sheath subtilisin-like domain-containing protein [Rhizobiaceae bacterium]